MTQTKRRALTVLIFCCLTLCAAAVFLWGEPARAGAESTIALSKPALELEPGMSEQVTAEEEVTWSSDDESVATVRGKGIIEAVGVGETTVRARGASGEGAVRVIVVEKKKSTNDNIMITAFWPPPYSLLGDDDEKWDEQYKLMGDAQIDFISGQHSDLCTKELNLKMAEYAYRYGIRLNVMDGRFAWSWTDLPTEQIVQYVSEYRNIPGVGGYFIVDEPYNPVSMGYPRVWEAIKSADPDCYAHLNFLPMEAYSSSPSQWQDGESAYRSVIGSWAEAVLATGYPQDYLMFDQYPYVSGTDMLRNQYITHLEIFRQLGLQYGMRTANYLQTEGWQGMRSPSVSEIRYEAMLSLAFGMKELAFFTWYTSGENGIIGYDGTPNELTYEGICYLNAEIHALGKTLVRLDAEEVYLNGTLWGKTGAIPEGFVVEPLDGKDFTVSLMKDRETGRNYLFFVNNDYTTAAQFSVKPDARIARKLKKVSAEDGKLKDVDVAEDGTLTIALHAGNGELYALPEGFDFTEEHEPFDTSAAEAALARVGREDLAGKDTSELDAAAAELGELIRYAGEGVVLQSYTEELTEKVLRLLDEALAPADPPEETPSGPPEDPPSEKEGGCGGTIGAGGGTAVLLLGALFLIFRKKTKKEKIDE